MDKRAYEIGEGTAHGDHGVDETEDGAVEVRHVVDVLPSLLAHVVGVDEVDNAERDARNGEYAKEVYRSPRLEANAREDE